MIFFSPTLSEMNDREVLIFKCEEEERGAGGGGGMLVALIR